MCVGRGYINYNVSQDIPKPAKEKPRDRVLSIKEIQMIYKACDQLDPFASSFVKVLILTGQRRGEIAGLRLQEIENDLITIPEERSKNGKVIITPITKSLDI